ncbi:MAG TPA: TrmB family transcriptional regulator [Methanofollis liminatans]|uniref:TrmB family transcriptional regulator n=1 Tax=Methanofollis liminatans TaxID=2201 RepID=A0A831M1L4_9EURY|nr:TrmB family transcriptional regulator [Methanofollis liminatans]
MTEDIVPLLKNLGLNEYEAKVYSTLVGLRKATARDIHEISGVPRGRIYEILHDLAQRGFIGVEEGSPTCYYLLDPDEVIDHLKEEYLCTLEKTRRAIREISFALPRPPPSVYMLRSDWAIDNHVRSLLKRAKKQVLLVCRDRQFLKRYLKELKAAEKRVDLCILVRNPDDFDGLDIPFVQAKGFVAELLDDAANSHPQFDGTVVFVDYGEFFITSLGGPETLAMTGSDAPMMRYLQHSLMASLDR